VSDRPAVLQSVTEVDHLVAVVLIASVGGARGRGGHRRCERSRVRAQDGSLCARCREHWRSGETLALEGEQGSAPHVAIERALLDNASGSHRAVSPLRAEAVAIGYVDDTKHGRPRATSCLIGRVLRAMGCTRADGDARRVCGSCRGSFLDGFSYPVVGVAGSAGVSPWRRITAPIAAGSGGPPAAAAITSATSWK
jgi:hypothetical protein